MRSFQDISIKQKLTSIIMLTSCVVVLLTCLAFVTNDLATFHRSMPREVSILARIIGTNSTAALVFKDRKSAAETLSALSAQPHIVTACIYDKDGNAMARYVRREGKKVLPPLIPEPDGFRFQGDSLHLFRRIVLDREVIGTVYLQYDLKEFWSRGKQYAIIVVLILFAGLTLSFLLSARLQRLISRPILHLADIVRAVSQQKDYSLRAEKFGQDEVGDLIDGFNEMLTQVQDRDARLERHRELLEEQVAIRTTALRKANDELLAEMAEREQTEKALASEKERLTVTLHSIGDGVLVTDLAGRILLLNKVAEELTGWTQEEALNLPLHKVFRIIETATGNFRADLVGDVLTKNDVVSHADASTFIAKDGTELLVVYNSAPIRDKSGDLIGVILAFRDITEKQKVEEELLRSRKLESIGILAGGIAHDFNNFLMAILGNISIAKMMTAPSDKVYQKLEEAEKATLRAKGLTQQLLTFSRGGAPIKKVLSISEIIKDATTFTLAGSNVKGNFEFEDDLWSVEVDEGQMSQVINNLMINACQAMPDGGVVRLQAKNVTVSEEDPSALRPGRYVRISVEDQGSGISEDYLEKIFDPYFTTKENGTGLGLATCYSIVKKHDGLITARSRLQLGTTFYVWLPAVEVADAQYLKNEAEYPLEGKGRVLLMDDEEMIRDVAGEMLMHMGYEVSFAQNGVEAIEMYLKSWEADRPYDAAIMDLTVPGGMGGGEAIRRLIAIDANVKAIVSSGYANDPIMSDYKKCGFAGVVVKPYKTEELGRVLSEVISTTS